MKKITFSRLKFVMLTVLLTMFTSTNVFAYTTYEESHRDHYNKIFFYTYPLQYGTNGKVNINYSYTEAGSHYFGYRVLLAAYALGGTSTYSNWYMSYNNYPPFLLTEVSPSSANVPITSNNYGNVDWVGLCSASSKVKNIKINEYFMDDGYYNYALEEYTVVILHEMLHSVGLDHYNCNDEVMLSAKRGYNYDLHPGDIGGIYDKY